MPVEARRSHIREFEGYDCLCECITSDKARGVGLYRLGVHNAGDDGNRIDHWTLHIELIGYMLYAIRYMLHTA